MSDRLGIELKMQCIQWINACIPIGWLQWFTYDRKKEPKLIFPDSHIKDIDFLLTPTFKLTIMLLKKYPGEVLNACLKTFANYLLLVLSYTYRVIIYILSAKVLIYLFSDLKGVKGFFGINMHHAEVLAHTVINISNTVQILCISMLMIMASLPVLRYFSEISFLKRKHMDVFVPPFIVLWESDDTELIPHLYRVDLKPLLIQNQSKQVQDSIYAEMSLAERFVIFGAPILFKMDEKMDLNNMEFLNSYRQAMLDANLNAYQGLSNCTRSKQAIMVTIKEVTHQIYNLITLMAFNAIRSIVCSIRTRRYL